MSDENATAAENVRTRAEVSKRTFLLPSGEYTARATTESVGARIELVESGEVLEFKLSDFSQGVINAAALFGLVTSITNTFGGKGLAGEERAALAIDRLETLQEGDWSAERQSGPRTSQLLEAIKRVASAQGKEVDQGWLDRKAGEIKDPEVAKRYQSNAQVAAALAAIKAEAATARAQKAAAKASGKEADDDLFA